MQWIGTEVVCCMNAPLGKPRSCLLGFGKRRFVVSVMVVPRAHGGSFLPPREEMRVLCVGFARLSVDEMLCSF